jgi:O-succinylbenzoic acid--CoA ligase
LSAPHRWLAARAAERPGHPALITHKGVTTYAELEREATRLAARLSALGIGRGDRVAALLPNDALHVQLIHALLALEATLVPLNLRLLEADLRGLLQDARPRLLVCAESHVGLARAAADGLDLRVSAAAELDALTPAPGPLAKRLDPSADQAVIFTSGTTGRPRGVRLSSANQLASARASAGRLGVRADDRWLACMPLYHVGGLAIVLRCAIYGTTIVLHEGFDAGAVAHALRHEEIRLVSLVPTMLERVIDARGFQGGGPALRVVLLGGGPIPPSLLERSRALGLPLAPTYGLTEAASQVATLAPGELEEAGGTAGRALPDTDLRIADERGARQPPGVPGEILVRGPQVTAGYLDRPDETRRSLAHGWLHTNDVGVLDERGFLRVLDRRSDLIVSGGENVMPAEVEAALLAHPEVFDAGVIARTDPAWGQRVHAVVVLRPGARAGARELERWAREHLAGFKRPRGYSFASALPRTATGKLRREVLRRQLDRGESTG